MPESREISVQIEKLGQGINDLGTKIETFGVKLDQVGDAVAKLQRSIEGDGIQPGLILKVDRLEQNQERLQFWTRTAIGSAILAAFSAIASVFWHPR